MKTSCITTAIPYVNAEPHLGFALELVQADVIARASRSRGLDTYFVAGTDDNALKNVIAAEKAGVAIRDFIASNTAKFRALKELFNISYDDFIGTSEARHHRGVEEFWKSCREEDIYQKKYRGTYCVGCEEFKTAKELIGGYCPEHPHVPLETVAEENYFFRLSTYQRELEQLIAADKLRIIPETRKNEMLQFIRGGLEDFSISRSKARARGWGIPVPGDSSQMIYVWFDALVNYLTVLGYGARDERFKKYWTNGDRILHVIGKGVSRFHAVYWIAMLRSAGIRIPTEIFVHSYLTIEGQKISKSLGNVVSPKEVVGEYGIDATRYYLLREISPFADGDFSVATFRNRYNGDLANGLGNFAARVLTLAARAQDQIKSDEQIETAVASAIEGARRAVSLKLDKFAFHEALAALWELVSFGDRYVNDRKVWAMGVPAAQAVAISNLIAILDNVAKLLEPFLPGTSKSITERIVWENGMLRVGKGAPLFPRRA